MSDVFSSTVFDHLDHNSRSIVDGFVYKATRSFIQRIPKTINYLILMMVDDHFMFNRGSYEWKISGTQQIQRILSAQPNAKFNSDIFEMSGLQCMMQLYPNGNSDASITAGNVSLFLRLLSFPKNWEYIIIHRTTICKETNTAHQGIVKYSARDLC